VPEGAVAAANTHVVSETPGADGRRRVVFATTEPLPTYLIAYAVGPFDVVEAPSIPPTPERSRALPLRGLAVHGRGGELAHALAETPRILGALERWFGLLTERQLRRGVHRSTLALEAAIEVARRRGAKLLLLSNNLDAKGMARFRTLLKGSVMDIEPRNVKEALALLNRASLVLAGNTDYFHFAVGMRLPTIGFFTRFDAANWFPKSTPWVQIIQGVRGQQVSVDEVCSKIDTLLHLSQQR